MEFNGPDRLKDAPAKPVAVPERLSESLEDVEAVHRGINASKVVLPPPAPVMLQDVNTALVVALQHAIARVEVANAEGDPILSAWLPDARAAVAKAEESRRTTTDVLALLRLVASEDSGLADTNPWMLEQVCALIAKAELLAQPLPGPEVDQTETDLHFTNLGASMQPNCADQEGFIRFRKNFQELPECEWTEGERWIDGMEKKNAEFNNR